MESPLLLDMAIHTVDAARYLVGRDAVSVYCEESNPSWSWFEHNASATALYEMEDGLQYTYCGSWVSDGRHTTWEANWRAVGENGSATWDDENKLLADIETFKAEIASANKMLTIAELGMALSFLNRNGSGRYRTRNGGVASTSRMALRPRMIQCGHFFVSA
jgi:predicted dehydrogenase